MDINTSVNLEKKNEKSASRILIISLAVIILVLFVLSLQLIYSLLKYDKMYKGINVNGINTGGLLPEELSNKLDKKYNNEVNSIVLTITSEGYKEKYYLKDFNFSYDLENIVDEAYSIGRNGNIFDRLFEILNVKFNKKDLYAEFYYDSNKIDEIVESLYDYIYVPVKNPSFEINGNYVLIDSGHNGKSIDKEQFKDNIMSFITNRKNTSINVPVNTLKKDDINIDTLFDEINSKPVNASSKIENGQLKIVSHKNGVNVDKDLLKTAVSKLNNTENKQEQVKISLIAPEITEDVLKSNLFKDVLSTFTTYFSTNGQLNIDRKENLRLAAEKINEKILLPGDIFSFNQTVGRRTIESGFKNAQVFVGGKIVEGLGGGICQVSSTLYNAVLKANLEIVERVNHMFTVPYVSSGLDATVAYGSIDFKFKNSTKWPLKIQAYLTNSNELVFKLIGTNDNKGLSVELIPHIIKTTPFKTVYFDDPNLSEGQLIVKQNGLNGYIVDTYKIIKQDGKELSRAKITTSVYTPLDKNVSRGTKKIAEDDNKTDLLDDNNSNISDIKDNSSQTDINDETNKNLNTDNDSSVDKDIDIDSDIDTIDSNTDNNISTDIDKVSDNEISNSENSDSEPNSDNSNIIDSDKDSGIGKDIDKGIDKDIGGNSNSN